MTNPHDSSTPFLACSALHTYYGSSHILHGIDFHIQKGEALALMGRNGMGKSTLIKSLLGIVPIQKGTVWIGGQPVTAKPTYQRIQQGIAYVPEGRGIFPNLSVLENLTMAARSGVNGQNDWTLERAFDTFPRLAERINYGGGQLSGGEQQMLTIGRALMTNPDLLILDEATEGLAPMIAHDIWRIVRDVRATGIATILVDKNHSMVTRITDRAVILLKGSVVYEGNSEDLRRNQSLIHQYLGV